MIRRNKNVKSKPNPKKKRLNQNKEKKALVNTNGEQSNTSIIDNETGIDDLVAPEIDEQSPQIYKLPVEIMMEISNFLALKDLNSVSQTSKWWQKVACACFQQNYSPFHTNYHRKTLLGRDNFNAFKQLIHRITFANTYE